MVERYREFYERAGELYPEDKFTYSSLSGIMRKKWVTRKIAQLPPGNLLDCGCNIGRLAAEWKRGMVIGVDIAFALLKKGKNLYPDINFIQGDLMNLRFLKPNSIDNALAIEVIEHLPRVDDFLKELTKVLKTNGTVLVTTPSYSRKRPVFT
ncbi:MAG: class I SAM-dependent methyltransferase, partial [candidate division WOR-3 bacterium]